MTSKKRCPSKFLGHQRSVKYFDRGHKMQIISYEAGGSTENDLHFPEINFGKFNLVVGDSATGKSRLLNTIFNVGRMAAQKVQTQFFLGYWNIIFEHKSNRYKWSIETHKPEGDEEANIVQEQLLVLENHSEYKLVERTIDTFKFNGNDLPRLSPRESSISLLRDEDLIKPIHEAFASILKRQFSGSVLDDTTSFQNITQNFIELIQKKRELDLLFHSNLNLSCRLYILAEMFSDIYEKICDEFKAIFPFVNEVKVLDAEQFGLSYPGIVPVFAIKEKFHDKWISIKELSSGMKKVLLILTDISLLPKVGGVYLIDEYENSLGINAINTFPNVLLDSENSNQFIITSHHPYIIGNAPVKDWIMMHRKGNQIYVKQGEEIVKRFSKSRQQAFIQLINDPFFVEGVE